MATSSLKELGWKPCFEQQLSDLCFGSPFNCVPARVAAHFGSQLLLLAERGEIFVPIQLADSCGPVAVGDWVLIENDTHRCRFRLDRQTELCRKAAGTASQHQLIAANIDTLFVVTSCNQDFNLARLERYLALVLESDAVPIVVLTKADLCEELADLRRQAEQLHTGLLVECVDARDPQQVSVLQTWCSKGKTVGLLGSSGVGKSTLANSLGAGKLATAEIRVQDGKGRHTTSHRSLHRLSSGGWLLDTPGMRELQIVDCEEGVAELFQDILALAGQCRFRDCAHQEDLGCAIRTAVENGDVEARRLASFLKLQAEQAKNAQSLMERRRDQRKTGRLYKSIISGKRQSRDLR